MQLTTNQEDALRSLLGALVDQRAARVIVRPRQSGKGFWFGAGNLVAHDGSLWLSGRYRNAGDARTGGAPGARGVSCDVFRADAEGASFERIATWSKADLAHDAEVLSIEGSALQRLPDGSWELYVSTEKDEAYPEAFAPYQKPGTGVWSIDRMRGPTPGELDPGSLERVLSGSAPEYLHVKDPVVVDRGDRTHLLFSAHPISWASSNTGLALRADGDAAFRVESPQLIPRGAVWDVAATRVTDRFAVPRVGVFADTPEVEVLCYDGAESMRRLDEGPRARSRPRGWSGEEIGGALWAPKGELASARRLSRAEAWFTSPYGTGSSRYVKTLRTEGGMFASWQQAQDDGSQPLVMTFVPHDRVEALLDR